jgi:hypothetical protein
VEHIQGLWEKNLVPELSDEAPSVWIKWPPCQHHRTHHHPHSTLRAPSLQSEPSPGCQEPKAAVPIPSPTSPIPAPNADNCRSRSRDGRFCSPVSAAVPSLYRHVWPKFLSCGTREEVDSCTKPLGDIPVPARVLRLSHARTATRVCKTGHRQHSTGASGAHQHHCPDVTSHRQRLEGTLELRHVGCWEVGTARTL